MIDFTDPNFVADPYPALKLLREAPGPVWHEQMQIKNFIRKIPVPQEY